MSPKVKHWLPPMDCQRVAIYFFFLSLFYWLLLKLSKKLTWGGCLHSHQGVGVSSDMNCTDSHCRVWDLGMLFFFLQKIVIKSSFTVPFMCFLKEMNYFCVSLCLLAGSILQAQLSWWHFSFNQLQQASVKQRFSNWSRWVEGRAQRDVRQYLPLISLTMCEVKVTDACCFYENCLFVACLADLAWLPTRTTIASTETVSHNSWRQ